MGWLTLLPAVVAITLALWKREVILALFAALFTAELLILGGNPAQAAAGTLDRLLATLGDSGSAKILMFSLLMGALLKLLRDSGGVNGFVRWLTQAGLTKTPRQASLLASGLGLGIFIESNLSVLTAGIVSQKLFDKFNMSRLRLAYLIDATCAPGRVTIPLNAWGAYVIGLVSVYNLPNPTATLVRSIPLNFYALLTLGLVFFTAISGKVFGPLKTLEAEEMKNRPPAAELEDSEGKARFMVIPLVTLIGGILGFMVLTGKGDIMAGSGATSVLWATCSALFVMYLLLRGHGLFRHKELVKKGFAGMADLLPLVTIVLFAMSLGAAMKALGTGSFVASLLGDTLPAYLICPFVFLAGALISFTTGTSWGTFAIMMPLAMPLGMHVGLPPELVLGAVLGGGVFGDGVSPISDTTTVSSLAAGCDMLDHVRTQLPYALTAGTGAFIAYLLAGLMV